MAFRTHNGLFPSPACSGDGTGKEDQTGSASENAAAIKADPDSKYSKTFQELHFGTVLNYDFQLNRADLENEMGVHDLRDENEVGRMIQDSHMFY